MEAVRKAARAMLSRVIANDRVTAPLGAPFTEVAGEGGPGEVEEMPRGSGLRRAIGELLVCPFCLGQWVATGIITGLAVVPRQSLVETPLSA